MMFIARFNKLIRNKILWSIFAFIVVLSFVAWTTQTGGPQAAENENRLGTLDGKAVPPAEFQAAYFNSLLATSLMFGRPLQVTAQVDSVLRTMAWRRLAALRALADLKLSVSADEVVAAIRQQPFFASQGQFQPERYQAFLRQFLPSLRATQAQFEEHIRQELLLNKAQYILAQAAWASPPEIQEVFHQLYDTYVLSYVSLSREEFAPGIQVSEEDAQAYFEGHREAFQIPEQMRVKAVAFPIENFMDESACAEEVLREYYAEHIEDFTVRDDDDQLTATPFEEVADRLRRDLAWQTALVQAEDKASDFEVSLVSDRQGHAPTFEDAAHALGLPVCTSDYFAAQETIAGLAGGLELSRAAFELRPTPDDYFSRPLLGADAYYILAYADRRAARLADYQEVREEVLQAALQTRITEQLHQTAARVYEAVAAAVEQGTSFQQALAGSGLEVFTSEPFSIRAGLDEEEFAHIEALIRQVLQHNAGELTDLVAVTDGYMFGYVESCVPASHTLLNAVRDDLARYLLRRRETLVFIDWQEYLLAAAGFEDLAAQTSAARFAEESDEDYDAD